MYKRDVHPCSKASVLSSGTEWGFLPLPTVTIAPIINSCAVDLPSPGCIRKKASSFLRTLRTFLSMKSSESVEKAQEAKSTRDFLCQVPLLKKAFFAFSSIYLLY